MQFPIEANSNLPKNIVNNFFKVIKSIYARMGIYNVAYEDVKITLSDVFMPDVEYKSIEIFFSENHSLLLDNNDTPKLQERISQGYKD